MLCGARKAYSGAALGNPATGKAGIARALYVTAKPRRVVAYEALEEEFQLAEALIAARTPRGTFTDTTCPEDENLAVLRSPP